jgi:hypothetical protein
MTLHSWTKINAFGHAELQVTNPKEPCVKRESGALHVEDTFGPGRKNVSGSVSGNHMETATPLLMITMAALLNWGLIRLVLS